jgi:hypothetical protein
MKPQLTPAILMDVKDMIVEYRGGIRDPSIHLLDIVTVITA